MQVRSLTKRHKSLEEEVANHLKVIQDLSEKGANFEEEDEDNKATVDAACSTP